MRVIRTRTYVASELTIPQQDFLSASAVVGEVYQGQG
jgi:hypothetical protein